MSGSLIVFIVLCAAAAVTGAVFKPGAWYKSLDKPAWTPPNWLFPIAWSLLYATIAVAGWLVWRSAGATALWPALTLYGLQLVFNALWSALFFGVRRMDFALVDVAALWAAIAATIIAFWPISTTAALLLLPYFAWVSFAAILNLAMVRRNPRLAA